MLRNHLCHALVIDKFCADPDGSIGFPCPLQITDIFTAREPLLDASKISTSWHLARLIRIRSARMYRSVQST